MADFPPPRRAAGREAGVCGAAPSAHGRGALRAGHQAVRPLWRQLAAARGAVSLTHYPDAIKALAWRQRWCGGSSEWGISDHASVPLGAWGDATADQQRRGGLGNASLTLAMAPRRNQGRRVEFEIGVMKTFAWGLPKRHHAAIR